MKLTSLNAAEKVALILLANADGLPVELSTMTRSYRFVTSVAFDKPGYLVRETLQRAVGRLVTSRLAEWAHRYDHNQTAWATPDGIALGRQLLGSEFAERVVAAGVDHLPKSRRPTKWRQKRGRRG